MSVSLTVRDVPEDVHDALSQAARERGQSLQAFLLGVLSRQADFSHNRQILVEVDRDLHTGGAAQADAPDASALLTQARSRRDRPGSSATRGAGHAA